MNIRNLIIFIVLITCSSLCFSQKLKVTNVFGADSDSNTASDLFFNTSETEASGDTASFYGFTLGDRLQADYSSPLISGRGRLEFSFLKTSDSDESFFFDPSGYIYITPLPQLGFFAGNNAFKKFVIPSSYLAAADDYTKYGRMITDTVSTDEDYRQIPENFFIPSQVLIGGITSDWFFGKKDRNYLRLAVSSSVNTDQSEENSYSIDSAINFGNTKLFDFGVTGRNLTGGFNMKWGVFAGLKSIENLILNGSFYYNFTSEDYLPEVAVLKTDDDDEEYYGYKKQKTLFALGLSGGYYFKKYRFGIYGDFISGLNSKYVENVRTYYNGELDSSSYEIVDRSGADSSTSTPVKIKVKTTSSGKIKTTYKPDYFPENAVPFYSQLRLDYQFTDQVFSSLNLKLRSMFNASDNSWITIYPKLNFKLPCNSGDISTGLRMDFNLSRYEGLSSFSVPLTWTYSFGKDFRK